MLLHSTLRHNLLESGISKLRMEQTVLALFLLAIGVTTTVLIREFYQYFGYSLFLGIICTIVWIALMFSSVHLLACKERKLRKYRKAFRYETEILAKAATDDVADLRSISLNLVSDEELGTFH